MGIVESLKLIRRCGKNEPSRFRKIRLKMVEVVANITLLTALIEPIVEEEPLNDLLVEWGTIMKDPICVIRNIIKNAVSSQHIYLICRWLVKMFGEKEKSLCIEFYIRALTVNVNESESHKLNMDLEKVKEADNRLADGFLLLAEYLNEDIITCRECVLTAFSLNPTMSCYETIKRLAQASGKFGNQIDYQSLNSGKPLESNQSTCLKIDTGQSNSDSTSLSQSEGDSQNTDESVISEVIQSPIHISDAQNIGIHQTLWDDLLSLISTARYLVLNWELDWMELSSRCQKYLSSGKEVRSSEKELKYLNIDYNQFKDWPKEKEFDSGIEKGFEDYVLSGSDDEFGGKLEPLSLLEPDSNFKVQEKMFFEDTFSSNSSGSEYEPTGAKNKTKRKKKLVLSSSCNEEKRRTNHSKKDDTSELRKKVLESKLSKKGFEGAKLSKKKHESIKPPKKFSNSTLKVLKKESCTGQKRKSLPLSNKNNKKIKLEVDEPRLPQFSKFPDLLDLKSIEEDAASPKSPLEPFKKSIGGNFVKNSIGLSPINPKVPVPTKNLNKPTFCIAENDLLYSSLAPFSSPPKNSNPNVLKSLRNFRPKKPVSCISESDPSKRNMLSTIDLVPRILSRFKTLANGKQEVITIDVDSEPEIIDLVDDEDEEEDNNMNTINSSCFNKKFQFEMKNNLKKPTVLDSILLSNNRSRNKTIPAISKVLGLNSTRMIRPATSDTTVQIVQFSNSHCPLTTSNSSSAPVTSVLNTVPHQTAPVTHGQVSASNLTSNSTAMYTTVQQTPTTSPAQTSNSNTPPVTTILYTMPHQTAPVSQQHVSASNSTAMYTVVQQTPITSPAQTTNSNFIPSTSVIYSVSQQTTPSHAQPQNIPGNSGSVSKPLTFMSKPSNGNRGMSTSSSQNTVVNMSHLNVSAGTSGRSFFPTAQRQAFSQSAGVFLSRQSPEHALLNPNTNSPTSSTAFRRQTPSPRDSVIPLTSPENQSGNIGVIHVENISLVTSEPNQPVPNLSPIKTQVSLRKPVRSLNRQPYVRSNVTRTAPTSAQPHFVVNSEKPTTTSSTTSSSSQTISGKSMPVIAHIRRVGYPQDVQKFIFKDGALIPATQKFGCEKEGETSNVSVVLNAEQTKVLTKSTVQKFKAHPKQEDVCSPQGASLPKFQQAFGRTIYQSSNSTTSNNTSEPSSQVEATQLNFSQPIQTTNTSTESGPPTVCAVLSKGVQTSNKDPDILNKNSQTSKSNEFSCKLMSVQGSTSTSTIQSVPVCNTSSQSETSNELKHSGDRPTTQTPVKLVCKLQGKPVILKTTSEKLAQGKFDADNRTVIQSNMSAILAAALQPQLRQANSTVSASFQTVLKSSTEVEKKKPEQILSSSKTLLTKTYRKPSVVNQPASRFTKSQIQVPVTGSNQSNEVSTPVVTIPIRTVLATGQQAAAISRLSVDRTELRESLVNPSLPDEQSGSVFEALQEFEAVLQNVKKTSEEKERTSSTTVKVQPQPSIGKKILIPSSSASVEFTNASTTHTALFHSTSTSTVHDLQGERVSLTFISQPSSGASNTLIAGTSQKITPVVVVQSCNKPVTSPALSVTSQSSSSPAPPSTPGSSSGKITTSVVKQNKSNKTKTASKTTPPTTLKVSPLPKPQQKPQEDEQTTQRIYAILDKYAEQLRNSPELKNKPAPRRRSNPPTNPSQNSKRKKSTQTKSKLPSQASCSSSGMEMSPGSEDMHTMGSEDSSNGVSQLSQTLNSPQSRQDDPSTPTGGDVSSETSESLDSRDTRIQSRMVLTDSSPGPSRTVIVQEGVQTPVLNVDTNKFISGKPVVVSSQAILPQLVLPGVQKMLFSKPSDGRSLKGTKMYTVHQVTLPKGIAPAVVLRQVCGGSQVKQVKLPSVSNITSQNLSSVMSSASQFTITHDTTLESGDSINILDNAILLNSSTSQPLSFVQQSIPASSYQSQVQDKPIATATITASSATSVQKPTITYSKSDSNLSYIKQEAGTMSACSSICVAPLSSPQDIKTIKSEKPSNSTHIKLEGELEFSSSNRTSEMATLVISQNSSEEKAWKSTRSVPSNSVKVEDAPQDFGNFQAIKTMMAHRPSTSSRQQQEERIIDSKKILEKRIIKDGDQDLVKEEKPERVLQEPELCDEESVSSDSAGSGRVKTGRGNKAHLIPEASQDTGSSWPYNVTKIDCIVKSESPNTSSKMPDTENHSLNFNHPQSGGYKKKANNVEHTIYQMAFKRSDRSKTTIKEHERNIAALERDLRLQKSLSEECEDLGVDEPSTSDLFPEAELLLDPDHSSHDSQLDLPSETLSQTLNSSSSCDSRAMSPMFSVGKRPSTYRSTKSVTSRSSKFVPIFNPSFQLAEESTSGTVSSTRDDSPDSQMISYKLKGSKSGSNSESNSPFMTKTNVKGNVSPGEVLHHKAFACDQNKSSSSGASTPLNGGESNSSPNHDELPNSCASEETRCIKKAESDNCKDAEIDTTDSDSNIDAINISSCQENSPVTKNTFIPIPNPAANAPYTYGGSKGSHRLSSKKMQTKREIWKNIIKGCDDKEDLDSDLSDPDQARNSDKISTSTEEDLQSEGEARAKNGWVTDKDNQSSNDRNKKTGKKSKKSEPTLKSSSTKGKVPRKAESQLSEEVQPEHPTSTNACENASRRASLRGHVKKNCRCCNGSQENSKRKFNVCVTYPSDISDCVSTVPKKKKQQSLVKSHITKQR